MHILVDIGHPAHVHLFRNVISILTAKGHKVIVTVRKIPLAIELLNIYKIPFIMLGDKSDSLKGKFVKQILYAIRMREIVRELNIDLLVGSSITIAHVSKITKVHSLWFDDDDDDVEPLIVRFGHPFATVLLSPDVLMGKRKKGGTLYYAGYHELAYLHPNIFKPDPEVLYSIGINSDEKYFILRFNSFKAHHDVNVMGLSINNKRRIIDLLLQYGKVFITSEGELEPEFEKFQLIIPPHKIHSFIYYSTILIGESQTMTSEAAVLGIPSIRCNSFVGRISYLEEQQHKYKLTFGFKPYQTEEMFSTLKELLNKPNLKYHWNQKQAVMLKEKINLSKFMVWIIENYPDSINVIKTQPDYQYNFN